MGQKLNRTKHKLSYKNLGKNLILTNDSFILGKRNRNRVSFDKNIQKAETSAKELGIKLPIAQYQKALEELKRNL